MQYIVWIGREDGDCADEQAHTPCHQAAGEMQGSKMVAEEMSAVAARPSAVGGVSQGWDAHIQGRVGRPKGADPLDAKVEMVPYIHRGGPNRVQGGSGCNIVSRA